MAERPCVQPLSLGQVSLLSLASVPLFLPNNFLIRRHRVLSSVTVMLTSSGHAIAN